MYKRLHLIKTKNRYKQIIFEMLNETKDLKSRFPNITMYQSIYDQILDIKDKIIDQGKIFTRDEIQKRYNLGSIATHNFDLEHEEYAQKISDIFGGSMEYYTFSDEPNSESF